MSTPHDVVMLGALAVVKPCEKCREKRRFYQCLECGVSFCRDCGDRHQQESEAK